MLCEMQCQKKRRQITDWEKVFAKDIYDKELFTKIYKILLKLNNKKQPLIKKWVNDL